VVGHIRIRTTNYQCHTVSVYLHIAAPLFRLSRIGIDFSRAIRLAIRPTARLFGFAHVFDVYTSSYCAGATGTARRRPPRPGFDVSILRSAQVPPNAILTGS
jgi:hypothetical protein